MKKPVIEVFESLAQRRQLTAKRVVELAKNPDSPLHKCFDWDDARAAHASRLNHARQLIREFTISVKVTGTKTPAQVRAFVNVGHSGGRGKPGTPYVPRAEVVDDRTRRIELIDQVLSQIERTLSLNADLNELTPVRAACQSVRVKLGKVAA